MNKLIASIFIVGFLAVDFLFFHDVLKPGEAISLPQYLTGILSIPLIVISVQSLLSHKHLKSK